ncbi:hypothetical protein GCM10022221_25940 [Actinocorallia aurea]
MTGAGRSRPGTRLGVRGGTSPAALDAFCAVDLAHVVTLAEGGRLPGARAAALLAEITRLRDAGFAELAGPESPHGLHRAYEEQLRRTLGARAGEPLRLGRTRGGFEATVGAVLLRAELTELSGGLARLIAVLLARARAHRAVAVPGRTPPLTYGHHLAGVATALSRDLSALERTVEELVRRPPTDARRTAALLGFASRPARAQDAAAFRDPLPRAVAVVGSAVATMSRLATDLQVWSTRESGFVVFPERLAGGGCAPPAGRGSVLLERLKAEAAVVSEAAVAEAGTGPPPGCAEALPAFAAARNAARLASVTVAGARPAVPRREPRVRPEFAVALRGPTSAVGTLVRSAPAEGRTAPGTAAEGCGGGPGGTGEVFAVLRGHLVDHAVWLAGHRVRQTRAEDELARAVARIVDRHPRDA